MKKLLQRGLSALAFTAVFAFGALAAPLGVADVSAQTCNPAEGIQGGFECAGGDTAQQTDLSEVVSYVVNILLFIVGAISVIMLIIGGIRYAVSGGDSGAVTSAKNTILYAIIGLVVALLAYVIVNFVITQVTGLSN